MVFMLIIGLVILSGLVWHASRERGMIRAQERAMSEVNDRIDLVIEINRDV